MTLVNLIESRTIWSWYSDLVMATESDRDIVTKLLGRRPQGSFDVVVRRRCGTPVVLANHPLLDDGRPMPTRFWLVDKRLLKAIGRLESIGGVNQAEAEVDPKALVACHSAYQKERAGHLPENYQGHTPSGGVGGTRQGVKCLHAHYANYLVGAEDPVGAWVHIQLQEVGEAFNPADQL